MEYQFEDKAGFMAKLKELFESGYSYEQMQIYMPNGDHDVEHLIEKYHKPSPLKYFTLAGGLTGCITGYLFTTYTAYHWPLITGGKPLFSFAPYTIIAFELTILFGALFSFAGIMILGKLPKVSKMLTPIDHGNYFVIKIDEEEK